MKTSLIVTLLNEAGTIEALLDSIIQQSVQPNEVVFIDGGSTDKTVSLIKGYKDKLRTCKVFTKKGNRSVGRNEAVKRSSGDLILITDAGCTLDKNWVKEIVKPFKDTSVDVVAGYYQPKADTVFQQCLTPFALVMPNRINARNFLPATRSMAIRKTIFLQAGGFNEQFSHNEDYVFANTLKKTGKKIVFTKLALANWIPRKTFKEAFVMFYRFAYGDIESGMIRPKVIALFMRYVVIAGIIIYAGLSASMLLIQIALLLLLVYCIWAFSKNYRYVRKWQALYLLPLLQFIADLAVMKGSYLGFRKRYGI